MIAVETKHHITLSSTSELPFKYCAGSCLKAWWKFDLENKGSKYCPQCGGKLKHTNGVNGFSVIHQEDGNLQAKHIEEYLGDSSAAPYIKDGAIINHLSGVKPEYEEKAKKEWR